MAHHATFALLLAVVAAYYLLLLSNLTFHLFEPDAYGHTFGSMLEHMLHGDFGVDRSTIGVEAFTCDGWAFAYFGIVPAVLRLLVIPFDDVARADVAGLSCLVAMAAHRNSIKTPVV